jgi:hypothetical protein
VERGQVISKLRASKIELKAFDGKAAFAKIVAEIETEKEARRFIRELFKTYPRNVLTARVVGDPYVPPGKASEAQTPLTCKVAVSVDPERYDTFVAKMLEVLRRAAVRSGSCSLRGAPVAPDGKILASFVAGAVAPADGETSTVLTIRRPPLPAHYPADYDWWEHWEWWSKGFDPRTDTIFLVNTGRSDEDDRLDLTWFHVPIVNLHTPDLRLVIRLVDEDGKEIKQDIVTLGPNFPGFNLSRRAVDSKKGDKVDGMQVLLSPYLVGGLRYCRQVVPNRQVNLSLDELRRVRGVRCKIGSAEAKDEEDIVVVKTGPVRIDSPPSPPKAVEDPEKVAAGHLARAEVHRLYQTGMTATPLPRHAVTKRTVTGPPGLRAEWWGTPASPSGWSRRAGQVETGDAKPPSPNGL